MKKKIESLKDSDVNFVFVIIILISIACLAFAKSVCERNVPTTSNHSIDIYELPDRYYTTDNEPYVLPLVDFNRK